jgi:hypothetical protein
LWSKNTSSPSISSMCLKEDTQLIFDIVYQQRISKSVNTLLMGGGDSSPIPACKQRPCYLWREDLAVERLCFT